MSKEYLKLEKEGADFMELEKLTLGSLRKAVIDGDVTNGTLMAGQIAGLVKREDSCREIILEIMEQAEALLDGKR
jgi:enoyl-[acyl-carrier protein] reductase II